MNNNMHNFSETQQALFFTLEWIFCSGMILGSCIPYKYSSDPATLFILENLSNQIFKSINCGLHTCLKPPLKKIDQLILIIRR